MATAVVTAGAATEHAEAPQLAELLNPEASRTSDIERRARAMLQSTWEKGERPIYVKGVLVGKCAPADGGKRWRYIDQFAQDYQEGSESELEDRKTRVWLQQ